MNFDSVMHHMNIILLYIKVGLKTYIMQKFYIYIYIYIYYIICMLQSSVSLFDLFGLLFDLL